MVIGGYAAALCIASAAVYVHQLHTQDAQAHASSGMYAFGDLLLFIAMFSALALLPTGLALYFLRPFEKFWTVLSVASLAVAVTGLCAAFVIVLSPAQPPESFWNILAVIGVLRVLLAPPLATVFALSAWVAPNRRSRRLLLAATVIEGSVGAYAFIVWFVWPVLSNFFHA